MEIEQITVTLGAREFVVPAAPIKRSRAWRRQLNDTIVPLLQQVAEAKDIQFATPGDLLRLTPLFSGILVDGIDQVCEMLITYAAVLEDEREYIEAHATDKQVFAAFQGVLRLSDPFGITNPRLLSRLGGLRENGTSASLPVASGESTTPPMTTSPNVNSVS